MFPLLTISIISTALEVWIVYFPMQKAFTDRFLLKLLSTGILTFFFTHGYILLISIT